MLMQGMASVEVSGPSGQTNKFISDRTNTNTETINMTMYLFVT